VLEWLDKCPASLRKASEKATPHEDLSGGDEGEDVDEGDGAE